MWFNSNMSATSTKATTDSSSNQGPIGESAELNSPPGTDITGCSNAVPANSMTDANNNNGHPSKPPPTQITAIQKQQSSDVSEKISFHLKASIFTRRVTIDREKMALGLIKQLAIAFLNELYFQNPYPPNTYIGDYIAKHFSNSDNINSLYDRLVLRKYNCSQESFLPFNSVSDIEPESYISIEVSEKQPTSHLLMMSSTAASASATNLSSSANSSASHPHHQQHQHAPSQVKMSHEFKSESYLFITHCASCTNLIGAFRQGYQCISCKRNFCPKCKVKAETSGDSCVAPAIAANQPSANHQAHTSSNQSPSSQPNQGSAAGQPSLQVGHCDNGATFNNGSSGNLNPNSKLDTSQLSNMSKRKSASNLLHFNIANPFKSHHAQQQATGSPQAVSKEEPRSKLRGSAGALDPVLQQLGKLKELSPPPAATTEQSSDSNSKTSPGEAVNLLGATNNLVVAQNTQISSSHQNLFLDRNEFIMPSSNTSGYSKADDSLAGSLSVHQSPINSTTRGHVNQLSNSARTSAHDLHASSPTSKTSDHLFISMDWIQINGKPLCGVCNKILKSQSHSLVSSSPPAMCKNCKLQVHAHCQDLVLADCLSRIAESSRAAAERQDANAPPLEKTGVANTNSNVSRDNIRLRRLVPSVKHVKRPDSTKPIIEGWLKHTTLSDQQARQHYWRLDDTDITLYENDTSRRYFQAIALNKITRVMSARSIPKRVKEDVLTTKAPELGTPTAVVADKQQTTKSANTSPAKSPQLQAQMNAIFAFELASGSMYLVQANSETEASKWLESLAAITAHKQQKQQETQQALEEASPATAPPSTPGGTVKTKPEAPQTLKKLVEFVNEICIDKDRNAAQANTNQPLPANLSAHKVEAIQQAKDNNKQPAEVTPAATPQPQTAPEKQTAPRQISIQRQRHHHHHPPSGGGHHRGGQHNSKTYTDPSRSRLYNRPRITVQINPMSIPDHWIVGKYLIERDRIKGSGFEELGSGQFGKVYAAISEIKAEDSSRGIWSGVPVAIKEISKARFDLRQQAKLKNEANILSQLDHPGVIILERVHDLPDKIYIVMEQLEDDMLEMIVSTEEKRLNERITKFLTYQILEALKYLHQKHIAHCDLKPENVLLVERRSQFPQIKLCDFGFAKIIEDNSFRSSLVGTPAYLAPEVVKGERYNRSVDLWSVGVIVYVSLSGEFPFNEGESIHDQISRANFMYPKNPWDGISVQAKNFINSLLRVNCEKRLSASRAQMDDWIQDYQLWCDLTELEVRVGRRWVTDDADFERWSKYAREHNLQLPRTAVQLHESLLAD